ncbi:MAG: hypothetical protein AB4041_06630 [Microcystaceae cyanobacterium]
MSGLLSHFFKSHSTINPFSAKKAPNIQDIQNIALVLGIKKLDTSHLNLDFLQKHNIIDKNWKLSSKSPKVPPNSQVVHLTFKNGVTLMGLPKSLIVREKIRIEPVSNLASLALLKRYINHFQNGVYNSLTFNMQRIFNLPNQQAFLGDYAKNNLFNERIFLGKTNPLLQADVHCNYNLERCQLNFRTKVGHLQPQSEKEIPFFLFLAGFKYKIYHFHAQERLRKIEQSLDYLEQDYQIFKALVEQRFLG